MSLYYGLLLAFYRNVNKLFKTMSYGCCLIFIPLVTNLFSYFSRAWKHCAFRPHTNCSLTQSFKWFSVSPEQYFVASVTSDKKHHIIVVKWNKGN